MAPTRPTIGCLGTLLRVGGFLMAVVGFGVAFKSPQKGFGLMIPGLFLMSLEGIFAETLAAGDGTPPTIRQRLGWLAYSFAFLQLFQSHWLACGFHLLVAYALAGAQPLEILLARARRWLTTIDAERWVDFFGNAVALLGIFLVLSNLLGKVGEMFIHPQTPLGEYLAVSPEAPREPLKPLSSVLNLTLPFIGGLITLAIGIGIRRRALWAGTLGLFAAVVVLVHAVNATFMTAGGDLTRLPTAITGHAFHLLLAWFLFLGFYSVFSPLISARARPLIDGLQDQLRTTDQALQETRSQLSQAVDGKAEAARQLEEERIKFKSLFENTNEGIAIFDADDRLRYANPAHCSLYDLRFADWEGKPWREMFARPGVTRQPAAGVVPAAGTEGGEVVIEDERGTLRRRIGYYTKAIIAPHGQTLAFMVLSRDVTLEREIDRMKTEFVSNVSHELRTPLTSIRAYTEMLLDDEADDPVTRREYLQIILDEGERLTNLINDILDLSKMEAGRRIFRFAPGHPLAVVRKVVTVVEPDARRKGLSLTPALPGEDREALIDADLLHQAVMNLAANAVKYTPAGGHLRLGLAWGETTYRIEVEDDGPGIAEEDQKRLFTKFFRVENSLNRDIGGTGLGLALVRQIAQVHQGQVGVRSTPGQGSRFHLELPYSFEPSPRVV